MFSLLRSINNNYSHKINIKLLTTNTVNKHIFDSWCKLKLRDIIYIQYGYLIRNKYKCKTNNFRPIPTS